MPNGHEHKKFGGHHYPFAPDRTSDCEYGCGCWAGPNRSGGPGGLDPFGECPNNPEDGVRRGGEIDRDQVINDRIQELERKAAGAKGELRKLTGGGDPKCGFCDKTKDEVTHLVAREGSTDAPMICNECILLSLQMIFDSLNMSNQCRKAAEEKLRDEAMANAKDIRAAGWAVAVHNDYVQDSLRQTFWLFTNGERAVKGEGVSDAEALNIVRARIAELKEGT
jgi:hypothetical protein